MGSLEESATQSDRLLPSVATTAKGLAEESAPNVPPLGGVKPSVGWPESPVFDESSATTMPLGLETLTLRLSLVPTPVEVPLETSEDALAYSPIQAMPLLLSPKAWTEVSVPLLIFQATQRELAAYNVVQPAGAQTLLPISRAKSNNKSPLFGALASEAVTVVLVAKAAPFA